MPEPHFNIQYGEFIDIDGPARRTGSISFVSAKVALWGTGFSSEHRLGEIVSDLSTEARALVKPGEDAPWVLGRLIRLFLTSQLPEEERGEKCCFVARFLAVFYDRDNLSVPFECSDYYARSALTFSSRQPPPDDIKEAIAVAFWGLLLSDPTDIADYEDQMYHIGAGVMIRFGVENGEPYLFEDIDND